jgi:hypothetical protein
MEGSVNASGVKVGIVGSGVGEGKVGKDVVVGNDIVGIGKNTGLAVAEGMARCVSACAVLAVAMAVCMISASFIVGVDWLLLQDASMPAKNKTRNVLSEMFTPHHL